MTPAAKHYVKLFVGFTFFYTLLVAILVVGLAVLTRDGRVVIFALFAATVGGVSVGAITSVALGTGHVYSLKKLGFAITDANLSAHQEKTVMAMCGYGEAFNRCVAAIESLPGVRILEDTSVEHGTIHARRASWWNWGETIQCRLRARTDERTLVTVSSRPRAVGTVLDYGRNLQNVETIASVLQGPLAVRKEPRSAR